MKQQKAKPVDPEFVDSATRQRLIGWNFTPNHAAAAASIKATSYGSAAPGALGAHTYNGLAGLETASVPEGSGMPADLHELFSPSGRKVQGKKFPGDLGKFIGELEQYEYALVLRGDKGAGKSRLLYQLMNLFSSVGLEIGNFSLEMAKDSLISTGYMEQYVAPENRTRIKSSSEAPQGIETIRKAAKFFDVIVIDSFSKIAGAKQEDFDKLRKEFPNVYWLVIFQSTTSGKSRGGSMTEYDAGAVLQVNPGGVAIFEKNRYATAESMELAYLVFEQKAVPLDSVA